MKIIRLTLLLSTALAFTIAGIFPQGAVLCFKDNGSFALEYGGEDSCACKPQKDTDTHCKARASSSEHLHCATACESQQGKDYFQNPDSCNDFKFISSLTFSTDSSNIFAAPYFIPPAPGQFEIKTAGIYCNYEITKEIPADTVLSHKMKQIKTTRLLI